MYDINKRSEVKRVSVVMAVCDGGKYLLEQLDSINNQTLPPDELIVCDDCSTDETLQILASFKEYANFPIVIIKNETRQGYSKTFCNAASLATGDIVFFSDQDDRWNESKILRVSEVFRNYKDADLVIHDVAYCREDLSPIGQTKIERMSGHYDLNEDYVTGMATAIRKDLLSICLPIPKSFAYDSWIHFCANMFLRKKIIYDVLAEYRRHSSNATISGGLNVNYVTNHKHFKKRLLKRFKEFSARPSLPIEKERAKIDWLSTNKSKMIENHLLDHLWICDEIDRLEKRLDALVQRKLILDQKKLFRWYTAGHFLISGGYRNFSGPVSFVKDVLFH